MITRQVFAVYRQPRSMYPERLGTVALWNGTPVVRLPAEIAEVVYEYLADRDLVWAPEHRTMIRVDLADAGHGRLVMSGLPVTGYETVEERDGASALGTAALNKALADMATLCAEINKEFREEEHPRRDESGKFARKGTGTAGSQAASEQPKAEPAQRTLQAPSRKAAEIYRRGEALAAMARARQYSHDFYMDDTPSEGVAAVMAALADTGLSAMLAGKRLTNMEIVNGWGNLTPSTMSLFTGSGQRLTSQTSRGMYVTGLNLHTGKPVLMILVNSAAGEWIEGDLKPFQSLGSNAMARSEAEKTMIIAAHELSHWLHDRLPPDRQQNISDAYAKGERAITRYGGVSEREWFAESHVVYLYEPQMLKDNTPIAYQAVHEARKVMGLPTYEDA